MMEKVGTEYSYKFLQDLGISTLTTADKQSPAALSLGGMTKGISPLELAAAYGTIANKGVYIEPKLYTRIEDRNGNLLLKKNSTIREVMSEENAYLLTDMMYTVTTGTQGTGRAARISGGIDVAAKTGTTSDDKDRWFSAFTPYYVGSVWYGYDTPKYINCATNPGTKMWHDVMEEVHKVKKCAAASFERPSGIVEIAVCKDSGMLASDACKQDPRGSRVIYEKFNSKNGTIPKQTCTIHEFVEVCPDTNLLPTDACRHATTTITVSRINRHYEEGQPVVKPSDYAYEVPTTYCNYHGSAQYVPTNTPAANEINDINNQVNNCEAISINNNTSTSNNNEEQNTETKPSNNGDTINADTDSIRWWER